MTDYMNQTDKKGHILALCGGVGAAKLASGLSAILDAKELDIVVNTGDDFEHWGMNISPDLDSVMYKLAGENDQQRGWGRAEETWTVLESLKKLGGESWFQLGDKDLAVHIRRTQLLREGCSLSEATSKLCQSFATKHQLIPMSDEVVQTFIQTPAGELPFQDYFVGRQCSPEVLGVRFNDIEKAQPSKAFVNSLASPHLRAVVLCPSNPFVSIDPIISLPGVRQKLKELSRSIPVIAVSPIINDQAVKGPAAKMFKSLGYACDALAVADYYQDIINGYILDQQDRALVENVSSELPIKIEQTMMRSHNDERDLATSIEHFVDELTKGISRQNYNQTQAPTRKAG